ncbi:MAG: endonuclease III [Chloroflexi bacterium]|nr:endonuclease III [Chloroflexota bacterium]
MAVTIDRLRESEEYEGIRRKALDVHQSLVQEYGEREWRPRRDATSTLVLTIMTQHTSDLNAERAFENLVDSLGTWEAVRDAPVELIALAIKSAGLANIKSRRIKEVLQRITELRGELSLDFLSSLANDEAKQWLTSLDGVGPKTAACVLLFALGKPAMPVDTHVYRVSKRIGLIGATSTVEAAHEILESITPAENVYAFHVNLITHGRRICKAQQPKCAQCVVYRLCDNPVTLPRYRMQDGER